MLIGNKQVESSDAKGDHRRSLRSSVSKGKSKIAPQDLDQDRLLIVINKFESI